MPQYCKFHHNHLWNALVKVVTKLSKPEKEKKAEKIQDKSNMGVLTDQLMVSSTITHDKLYFDYHLQDNNDKNIEDRDGDDDNEESLGANNQNMLQT